MLQRVPVLALAVLLTAASASATTTLMQDTFSGSLFSPEIGAWAATNTGNHSITSSGELKSISNASEGFVAQTDYVDPFDVPNAQVEYDFTLERGSSSWSGSGSGQGPLFQNQAVLGPGGTNVAINWWIGGIDNGNTVDNFLEFFISYDSGTSFERTSVEAPWVFGTTYNVQWNISSSSDKAIIDISDLGNWTVDLSSKSDIVSFRGFSFSSFQTAEGTQLVDNFLITTEAPAPVPEPGTMLLLGSGLVGLAGYGRRKRKK